MHKIPCQPRSCIEPDHSPLPDLSRFGYGKDGDRFLRPSSLDWLVRCSMRYALSSLDGIDDDSPGTATHTGSLIHAGIEAFHAEVLRTDVEKGIDAAMNAIRVRGPEFPLHDPDDVRISVKHYITDPRNQRAEIVLLEKKLAMSMDPHPSDPTGLPIILQGTSDQVRLMYGMNYLYDVKSGKPEERKMKYDHIYQLCTYWLLAETNGYPISKAYIIRTQAYRTRGASLPEPQGVFLEVPLSPRRVHLYMERVRYAVAQVRQGIIDFGPGEYCNYCPFNGLANCTNEVGRRFSLDV